MSYTSGEIQPPIMIFLDGTEFEVFRISNVTKAGGKHYLEFVMSPFPWVLPLVGIREKDLIFDETTPYGYLKRQYPASRYVILSDNPEKPVRLMLCTFDGNIPSVGSKDLEEIFKRTEEIETLKGRIAMLEAYNKKLQKEVFDMSIHSKEFFESQRELTNPRRRELLPSEMPEEVEMKTKKRSE